MLKILGGEVFITLMQAVLFMSLVELFIGQGYVNSTVVYCALVFSSVGLMLGLTVANTRRGR